MARAIAIFTGGITELRQAAVREDGTVFFRMQQVDRHYGYRWSAWVETTKRLDVEALADMDTYELGFATLRRAEPHGSNINNCALFNDAGEIRVRLPAIGMEA